jgi:metallo-beta-lactamase class B
MLNSFKIFMGIALFYACAPSVCAPSLATQETVHEHPWDQWGESNPDWVEDFEPFRVAGNIYYVGSKGLSSFLIATDNGHILLDGGMPQNAKQISDNIEALGFDIKDVKILLNSHAHFDHSGGLMALKEMSGAKLIASEGDRSALEGGFYLGYEDNLNYSAPPVSVDQLITDGETVALGGIELTAKITPGHTRGCTSWTMEVEEDGKNYEVLFFCGASVAGNSLKPEQYEGIVQDYKNTFEMTKDWQPDILLVNHPFYFDMLKRRQKQIEGDALAFVDRHAFKILWEKLYQDFEQSLEKAY